MSIQNKSQNNIYVGDMVIASLSIESQTRYKDLFEDGKKPDWFPINGTKGIVTEIAPYSEKIVVRWKPGSTSYCEGVDEWWCPISWVEKVENSQEKQTL